MIHYIFLLKCICKKKKKGILKVLGSACDPPKRSIYSPLWSKCEINPQYTPTPNYEGGFKLYSNLSKGRSIKIQHSSVRIIAKLKVIVF